MCKCRGVSITMVVAMIILAVGCATIMQGTSQEVGVSSVPGGASVSIDNKQYGTTPVVAKLSRKDHHIVVVEKEGFERFELPLVRKTSGWVWGNILFGGLIGLAVDAISGGLYKLTPEQVEAKLGSESGSYKLEDNTIYVFLLKEPSMDFQLIGQMKK